MSDIYIPSQEEQSRARAEGERKLGNLTSDQVLYLKHKAKTDLFFLAKGILGYEKLSPNLHGDVAKWIIKTQNEQFRELLLPRSHFKSTINTISDSIRAALPDVNGVCEYPYNLGPNIRLLIAHESATEAQRFLYSIATHFTSNPILLALYPDLVPVRGRERINNAQLDLPRTAFWPEPTFDTVGVGGKSQGRHFNIIKADDLYGNEATQSKSVRESTIFWVDNIQAFLITPKTDKIDFIGTRWAFDDLYEHLHKTYGDKLHKYIRSVEEYDKESNKRVPIFPEQFSTESLDILRKNPKIFNAQYANNPKEGGVAFEQSWKRFYNWSGRRNLVIMNGEESLTVDISALDKVILIDPAVSGDGGYVVTGMDHRGRIFILDAFRRSFKPPEMVDWLFQAVDKWNPRLVVIEKVLFSALYEPWLLREMQFRRKRFQVEGCPTNNKSKDSRVMGLSNYFQAGQVYFHHDQYDILKEFDEFGATDDYHVLDALAQGPKYWRTPPHFSIIKGQNEAVELLDRDKSTGYGSI